MRETCKTLHDVIHEVLLESESPSLDVQQEGSLEGFGVDSEPLLKDREVISIRELREQEQCDQIWRFFCHIGTILKVLGNFFVGLFSIWRNVYLIVAKMLCYWASFHCCR